MMMIACPKTDGWIISLDATVTSWSRSGVVSFRPTACCLSASRRRQFSTMMTAPSTISPKSIAPSDIRLPHVDFTQPGRNRPHRRVCTGWQVLARLSESLVDLLSGEVNVHVVLEYRLHLREPVARQRAGRLKSGDAREGGLDGES